MTSCRRCGGSLLPETSTCPQCDPVAPRLEPQAAALAAGNAQPHPAWVRRTFWGVLAGAAMVWGLVLTSQVRQARESARRTQCYGNYKGISLALHNYHEFYDSLPAAWMSDAEGKPLLSWRVELQPFLDASTLYREFDQTQQWDAPANTPFLARRPYIFGCPSQDNYESEFTHKAGVSGPGTVFEGGVPVRFDQITDGLGNTIYAGEIMHRLEWTKPVDVEGLKHLRLGDPQGFDGPHQRGVPFALMDGSHRFLSKDIDPEVLRRLFGRNDGLTLSERPDGTLEIPAEDAGLK